MVSIREDNNSEDQNDQCEKIKTEEDNRVDCQSTITQQLTDHHDDNNSSDETVILRSKSSPLIIDDSNDPLKEPFLTPEYTPHEFWFAQRDSFIHRSYNEKSSKSIDTSSKSLESDDPNPSKRDSFIRQSLNNIRRSFSKGVRRKKRSRSLDRTIRPTIVIKENSDDDNDGSGEMEEPVNGDMGNDVTCVDSNESNGMSVLYVPLKIDKRGHQRNSSSSSGASNRSTNSVALGHRSDHMAPLQGQNDTHGQSVVNLNSLARSPSQNTVKIDSKSIKQLSTSAPVAAPNVRSPSPHPTKSASFTSKSDGQPAAKEKKRKELSSGRQKKFHRHFSQVDNDEQVINYFSCALVSDILLQGHLYITDNYFAFYSNVFGFVTKLLIPTVSVVKISKEKTAKIIPNAVGVATADERHVFGSFMSREAAYRLMLDVWRPVAPVEPTEIVPKVPDVEISECSIEDDSSSAISGNESPPRVQDSTTSDASHSVRQRCPPVPDSPLTNSLPDTHELIDDGTATALPPDELNASPTENGSPATIPEPKKEQPPKLIYSSSNRIFEVEFPQNFTIVYIGVILAVLLTFMSGYLLYRILEMQARSNLYFPIDAKLDAAGEDLDVYAEVLKWQREMQIKSVDEAQIVLSSNLEQIARVRKSLETLSILIHDKTQPKLPVSSNFVTTDDYDTNELA